MSSAVESRKQKTKTIVSNSSHPLLKETFMVGLNKIVILWSSTGENDFVSSKHIICRQTFQGWCQRRNEQIATDFNIATKQRMLGLKIFVPVQTHNFCHSAVRFIIYWTISIFQAFFSPISSAIKLKVFLVLKARVKCLFPKTTPPHRLLLQEISKFSEKNLKTLNGSCFKEWC